MKKKLWFFLLVLFFLSVNIALADETMVFDSTNNYLGACQLTNKSEWEIPETLNVTKFQIWYSWNQGETTLPVKVYKDGEEFAEFTAARGSCDPYQAQWCNADYEINKTFTPGVYTTEIANQRQCLKPGGTGTVRLYSSIVASDITPTPTPTPRPKTTSTPEISPTKTVTPAPLTKTEECVCSCMSSNILVGVITLLISSGAGYFLCRRFWIRK